MERLPLLLPSGWHSSKDQQVIRGISGAALAELALAPPLLVRSVVADLRRTPRLSPRERLAVLARAGELFADAMLDEETPAAYCQRQALATGVPVSVPRDALCAMRAFLYGIADTLEAQRPRGAAHWQGIAGGAGCSVLWMRRGRVLAVMAPSNHPMTHVGWLQALGLGYNVVVRPGSRDPFTPLRLCRALIAAGLPLGELALLPSDHRGADAMVDTADLSIVYGGKETAERYADHPGVLIRGPGRSKVFVGDNQPEAAVIDVLADAVAGEGGVGCTNASALLTAGPPHRLAMALAERLAKLPALPPTDSRAVLPALPAAEAVRLRASLHGVEDLCLPFYRHAGVSELGDGSAVLHPAVLLCERPQADRFGAELPFPCIWVAPCDPAVDFDPLRGSLVLTLLTDNAAIVEVALGDPSIRKVFWGAPPAAAARRALPHDGHLAQFLMEAKGLSVGRWGADAAL